MYEYLTSVDAREAPVRAVDGDTLDLVLDLGLRTHVEARVRLLGVNAPEHGTDAGDAATAAVKAWLAAHPGPYTVRTHKDRTERYGRWLATLTAPDGADLVADMLAAGHVAPWDGRGARPVPKMAAPK